MFLNKISYSAQEGANMKTRIERLRAGFEKQYIDAFLVTDKTNLRYLTGFDLEQGDGGC